MMGGSDPSDRSVPPTALSNDAPRWQKGLVVLAAGLQLIVVALTFVSGLLWVGWPYVLANVFAIVGLVGVLVVGFRTGRKAAVLALLAVPLVSVGVIAGLAAFNEGQVARTACSDRELAAVAGLRSPTGGPLTFEGTYDGCQAAVDSDQTTEELTADFAATLRTSGWMVVHPEGGRMAQKDGVTIFVEPLTEADTGIQIAVNDDPPE